jgi:hypothetical protein
MTDRTSNPHTVANNAYDANIIPAETAARQEREGANYKQTPKSDPNSIDSTAGYAVDSEGLVNNYAVEPEMYYEVPGDIQQQSAGYLATHEQAENFGDVPSQLDADAAAHETEVAESFVSDDTAELTADV